MKKLLTLITLAIISFSFISKKEFTPPGTVKLNNNLFVDKTEISNFNWQEFEYWIKKKHGSNSKEHVAILPDTTVWLNEGSYNKPYVKHYYRHPAYKQYPVVGISYEQAVAFCKWRTMLVQHKINKKIIEYKLPTEAEWRIYSSDKISIDTKGNPKLNCALVSDSILAVSAVQYDVTAPVESYNKNNLGTYNVLGNVSEMLADKGISKGGSWKDEFKNCNTESNQVYTKPQSWLGFRCVCVVIPK